MNLSDLLLFPTDRIKTDNGLTLTTYENNGMQDALAQEYLGMIVSCKSKKEAQFIMILLFQSWSDGTLKIDVDEFFSVEE